MVKVLLEQAPCLIEHGRLVYETDSQAGLASIMGMKGNARRFPVVKELRLLCAAQDTEIELQWRPREEPHQVVADKLSKVEDNSQWALNHGVYCELLSHPALGGRLPTVDVFANHTNNKVRG